MVEVVLTEMSLDQQKPSRGSNKGGSNSSSSSKRERDEAEETAATTGGPYMSGTRQGEGRHSTDLRPFLLAYVLWSGMRQ